MRRIAVSILVRVTRPRPAPARRPVLPLFVSASVALLVVFAGSFGLHRYFDDWVFPVNAADALARGDTLAFVALPVGHHWSPIWNALEATNVAVAGWSSDVLIRTLTVLALVGACGWLCVVARALGCSTTATAVAVGVLALHHVNAAALYSFDTYSQCIADLLTWIVAGRLLVITCATDRASRLSIGEAGVLAGLVALGLMTKEQALAAAACVLWLAIFHFAQERTADRRVDEGPILFACAGVVVASGVFALARRATGIQFATDGAFSFCLRCAPLNTATLVGLVFLPVRSLFVFDAWRSASTIAGRVQLASAGAAAAALTIALMVGLVRAQTVEARRCHAATAGLLVASCFPTMVLAHVGELYAHTAVFWFALLSGQALDGWHGTQRVRRLSGAVALVYLASLAVGLRANLADMRASGNRAALWLDRYAVALADVPSGAVAFVRGEEPRKRPGDYGLYRLTDPEYLMLELPEVLEHRTGGRFHVVAEWSEDPGYVRRALGQGPIYDVRRVGDGISVVRHTPR
jgi:hypothetical protein